MGKGQRNSHRPDIPRNMNKQISIPGLPVQKPLTSLLDAMQDGHEYESVVGKPVLNIDIMQEFKRALLEISRIRGRSTICYMANVVNSNLAAPTAIDGMDDLPFCEMVDKIDSEEKNIDVILVTPGGSAEQVAKFVDKLRARFDSVGFILPYIAMSAGTIFCMSGDEIIMDSRAYVGPIDPQVPSKDGRYIPAQALLTLISNIQTRGNERLKKGDQPDWTDIQILNRIDAREIGNALSASQYSIELVTAYLAKYKFKNWTIHSSTGNPVTDDDKKQRAIEIATKLCDHSLWKTHSRGISRDMAHSECRLQITHPEDVVGLERAIRRFWALSYYAFENTTIYKVFVSANYSIVRNQVFHVVNGGAAHG